MPFAEISEPRDFSVTFLDSMYLFNQNQYHTGKYELCHLEDTKEYGYINIDFFEKVKAASNNKVKTYAPEGVEEFKETSSIISVKNETHPIKADSYRIFRIGFKLENPIVEIFPNVHNLRLDYFENRKHINTIQRLDIVNLEIPAIPIMDATTLQGGFDTIIHLPKNLAGKRFHPFSETTGNELPDGTRTTQPSQKYIFRARIFHPNKKELRLEKTRYVIEGYLYDPYEIDRIRKNIDNVSKKIFDVNNEIQGVKNIISRLKAKVSTSTLIAVVAILLTIFVSILNIFNEDIRDFIFR